MKWRQGRRSKNVQDRRLSGGGGKGKLAFGGIIMAIIAVVVFKQDPMQVLQNTLQGGGGSTQSQTRTLTAEEIADGEFVETMLAYTEDVWDELYPQLALHVKGRREAYKQPKLNLFSAKIQSACGMASSATGPFYCPADQEVYIDLQFWGELARRFGAPGDFAQAYVIAHEVAHHIQHLLGITDRVHKAKATMSETRYNQDSVRLELQADFFAGVWAYHIQRRVKDLLEPGDLQESFRAAAAIGDDTIQERARGEVRPETFTHGTSEQRLRWFKRGLESGDPTAFDPFTVRYEDL